MMCPAPHLVKLNKDRGIELNNRRMVGDMVDVRFVGGEDSGGRVFPAHAFIVSAFSPYLRALIRPAPGFAPATTTPLETDDDGVPSVPLLGVDPDAFDEVLTFIYTGKLTVRLDNAFRLLEAAHFLQLRDPDLVRECQDFLSAQLPTCDLDVFFRVWNAAEQFDLSSLRSSLLGVLEYRLDEFLRRDLFSSLGYEEMSLILGREQLCVGSERALFDAVVRWCAAQDVVQGNEEDSELAAELISRLGLPLMDESYLRKSLNSCLGEERSRQLADSRNRVRRQNHRRRQCQNCVYLFEYTRSETEILGIQEFVEQRRDAPSFACFDPASRSLSVLPAMTQGKSYYQHYGPHSASDYKMAVAGSRLLVAGGQVRISFEKEFLLKLQYPIKPTFCY